ncbi:MAG: hypothetical protein AABY22_02245 [Nanoarchaeota archaeon]
MRFTKLNSDKQVWVNINKYIINWDKPCASKLETAVKDFLKPYWKNYIILSQFRVPGSLLRCDFLNLNKKISIEVNGSQHEEFNKFFHKNRNNYFFSIRRDFQKLQWLEQNNFVVIEINENEVAELNLKFFEEKFGISII